MVLTSLFAALTAVCAWLSIPIPPVAFTLQTFGLLLTLGVLGGKWGSISIWLYLLLGLVGLPVFSGFRFGAAALLDATGGFLWGFAAGAVGGAYVETADLRSNDQKTGDGDEIHFCREDLRELGHRYYAAFAKQMDG